MKLWKKILISAAMIAGAVGANTALAAGAGAKLDKAPIDTTNLPSLQNGAKIFVNYCLSCHSAAFVRYNRLQDIGLTEAQIKDNLLFAGANKVGDTMRATIDPVDAKKWFGANPPDLTLVARSRAGMGGSGADYLYTLLRSYYRDDTRPTGWNNTVFPNIGMPNPLWQLQGEQAPVMEGGHEGATHHFTGEWKSVKAGTMSQAEYDAAVGDLVNFLQWAAEPAQNKRVQIGIWVMLFLAMFTFLAWRLNKAYWKDVK